MKNKKGVLHLNWHNILIEIYTSIRDAVSFQKIRIPGQSRAARDP